MKRASRISHGQRGAATLVIVMVLFLVMALLAAYANRSLMFEQRISSSYYRASMAQEMAEGGMEWTLAMLNGTAINGNCEAVSTGGTRFVDKYLNVSTVDRATVAKSSAPLNIAAHCARTETGLVCSCPAADARTTQAATAANGFLVPSVGIALGTAPAADPHYGSFQVTSLGCTDSSVDRCASGVAAMSQKSTAGSVQKASVAFIGAVPSSPTAPLTVKGTLTTAGTGGLGLHNTDPSSAGTLVVSGGAAPALNDDRMDSVPGTPPDQARIFGDTYLSSLPADALGNTRFFRVFMGMAPSRYPNHPAARVVTCPTSGGCDTQLVNAVSAGKRMLIVNGPMTISANSTIGSVAAPVLIVVNGAVTITGAMQLNGMLVALGNLNWTNTAGGVSQITGMVLVQGNMRADGRMDIVYSQSIANELRNRLGSYARVSGGWIDTY
ncbi:MAG TPA: PilX N-terminal domain-containing pilus assembly protein [Roseateles sp.]